MHGLAHPRGHLPPRVYWVRRILVLGTVLGLVVAVARLLAGGPDDDPGAQAVTAGSSASSSTPADGPPEDPAADPGSAPSVTPAQPQGPVAVAPAPTPTGAPVVLAEPTGPCAADEITVTPTVPKAVAGARVELVLELTGIRPACTFAVSPRTVVARVTSGKDRIWSSQECRRAVRTATVTVRSATPTKVVVPWHGRRSDDDCTRATSWALPGYYHVSAAVVGSEPGETQFRLTSPPRPVVTKTVQPKKQKKQR